ncbi:MAG: hypothetical protein ACTSRG_08075 [Candidatus Helarchaeota archaeon]
MTNVTFNVDKALHKKMKAHPEVKWSEILRRAIKEYLDKIEIPNQISVEELRDQFDSETLEILDNLDTEKEIEYYKRIRIGTDEAVIKIRARFGGIMWLLDTNALITCHKLSNPKLFKKNCTYTTIFL